jgi:hypothetical protein
MWCTLVTFTPHHLLLFPFSFLLVLPQSPSFTFMFFCSFVFRCRFCTWEKTGTTCLCESGLFPLHDDLQFHPFSNIISSHLWLNNIPLCTHTTFSLSIPPLKGIGRSHCYNKHGCAEISVVCWLWSLWVYTLES